LLMWCFRKASRYPRKKTARSEWQLHPSPLHTPFLPLRVN
jgi:hypothetical protein